MQHVTFDIIIGLLYCSVYLSPPPIYLCSAILQKDLDYSEWFVVVLQRGCGCVREEDRHLIRCFPSLEKGGALRCCPCFLMSALETTKTNPLQLHQRTHFCPLYTSRTSNCLSLKVSLLFFPTFVILSLSSSLSLSGIVFSHSGSLAPYSPTTSHSSRVGGLFSPWRHTHNKITAQVLKTDYTIPHYYSNVPSITSIHSSLSSHREGFNLKQDNKLLKCLNLVVQAITFSEREHQNHHLLTCAGEEVSEKSFTPHPPRQLGGLCYVGV